MKSSLKTFAFLLVSGGVASAASIVAGNFENTNFITPEGLALDATFTAKVGVLASGTVLTTTSTFDSILPNWKNAGDIPFASGDAAGYAGYFAGTASFTDATGIAGQIVSIWVTNGSNLNFVLSSPTTQFLADSAIPNSNSISLNEANLGIYQNLLGTYTPGGSNAATGGSYVLNNAVPEPSAVLLGALGALGLLRRRRN